MAAVAVANPQQPPGQFVQPSAGYKEIYNGPKVYDEEAETKGTDKQPAATYPHYLPVWDKDVVYPALTPFVHYEHGIDAKPSFKNLLANNAEVVDLTATIGAEVSGVQLHQLTNLGKDELALFVAQKKVVAFRNQDFANLPIDDALGYARYFGRLHIHPSSGAPKDFPETRTNSIAWHSDVTYEKQPPGTTFLYLLDGPSSGGDTLFLNQAAAYNRLSPAFQKRLHGLQAVHSAHEQAQQSKDRGGVVRREPITSTHPLVRTHPTIGEKALFVNPQFTRHIVGFKKEESDYLLKFLYDHMALSQDIQTRVRWAPGTVVVWDHEKTLDYTPPLVSLIGLHFIVAVVSLFVVKISFILHRARAFVCRYEL
ncbi:MAG: hypothetical protein M1833_007053 [Piccolia ochrophora]|nr:MAG: hypothetical protein M1833_007053 [Piccolia ochrophora]